MPVMEAGLVGLPVVSTNIPAAAEIGGQDVFTFRLESSPDEVAQMVQTWAEGAALTIYAPAFARNTPGEP